MRNDIILKLVLECLVVCLLDSSSIMLLDQVVPGLLSYNICFVPNHLVQVELLAITEFKLNY